MNKLNNIYKKLNIDNNKDFYNYFINLLKNYYTWNYFVDWNKVLNNIEKIEYELKIFNNIINKNNFKYEFKEYIEKYPNIIKIIPILVASRNKIFNILNCRNCNKIHYNFDDKDIDISKIILFIEKTGLLNLFEYNKINNVFDYMLGVEVGLNSHARKNKTGNMMENIIEKFVINNCKENNFNYIKNSFIYNINGKINLDISSIKYLNKRFDFIIYNKNYIYPIEVNFYNTNGSKIESIVEEYKILNKKLNINNIRFIWITDGIGWKLSNKILLDAINSINYVFNIDMISKNIFNDIFN